MALFLFDLDGTLITSYMLNRDRNYHRWRVLPNRREKLAGLLAGGHRLGIATNQGGVGLGYIVEADFEHKLAAVQAALGLSDIEVAVSFAHPKAVSAHLRTAEALKRRKPAGGMLREMIDREPEAAQAGVLYVGDRPEDEAAARAAGVDFCWAEDFFADPN